MQELKGEGWGEWSGTMCMEVVMKGGVGGRGFDVNL
jgi:hypothetical protein